MYDLPYHKEHDFKIIDEFIAKFPFSFLMGCSSDGKPVATQLPLFIEESNGRKVLRGHIMKHNDHHKAFLSNNNVLAVFTGRHTYVSGRWYSQPNTPSTWNYMSVHVTGKIKFLDDDALIDVLRMTSLYFEDHDLNSPTVFDNLSPAFINNVIHMIVAFEVEITDIDTVFKLSQDRDFESYQNIITELKKQDGDGREIADEMEKRQAKVFPNQRS